MVPLLAHGLESVAARRLVCEACGSEFSCDSGGACWCFEEPVRLPLPIDGQHNYQDCLCRDCLRKIAQDQAAAPE